jgi:hypothetical protein
VRRGGLLAFAAVTLAAAVLAVLGYLSLRQWEASAELVLLEQARDMAAAAGRSRSVADDFKLGPAVHARQDLVDAAKDFIFDQILGAPQALEDRKALEDHDGGVADLEGQIRVRRPERCATHSTPHDLNLLVFKSSCHSVTSGR